MGAPRGRRAVRRIRKELRFNRKPGVPEIIRAGEGRGQRPSGVHRGRLRDHDCVDRPGATNTKLSFKTNRGLRPRAPSQVSQEPHHARPSRARTSSGKCTSNGAQARDVAIGGYMSQPVRLKMQLVSRFGPMQTGPEVNLRAGSDTNCLTVNVTANSSSFCGPLIGSAPASRLIRRAFTP